MRDLRMVVDRSTLEYLIRAHGLGMVARGHVACGVSQEAAFPSQRRPFFADRSAGSVRTGLWRPIDGAVIPEVPEVAPPVLTGADLPIGRAENTRRPAEFTVFGGNRGSCGLQWRAKCDDYILQVRDR